MNLSTLFSGLQGYYEYAKVTAANAAEQSVSANSNTTLELDTEIADTLGNGSVAANAVSVPAGTYYFEAETAYVSDLSTPAPGTQAGIVNIFGLYNGSSRITANRVNGSENNGRSPKPSLCLAGSFVLSSSGSLTLRVLSNVSGGVGNSTSIALNPAWSGGDSGTAGIDQRTSLKLWKLA
jgi:hypothetical protein